MVDFAKCPLILEDSGSKSAQNVSEDGVIFRSLVAWGALPHVTSDGQVLLTISPAGKRLRLENRWHVFQDDFAVNRSG